MITIRSPTNGMEYMPFFNTRKGEIYEENNKKTHFIGHHGHDSHAEYDGQLWSRSDIESCNQHGKLLHNAGTYG